eukprot:6916207-Pyramimonas_sp.AAC.1
MRVLMRGGIHPALPPQSIGRSVGADNAGPRRVAGELSKLGRPTQCVKPAEAPRSPFRLYHCLLLLLLHVLLL